MKQQLNSKKNKKATDLDFYQPLNLERSSMVIPISDIDSIVNTYKVFDNERNSSTKYRVNLTLNPIMTNVLVNNLSEIKSINNNTILIGDSRLNAIQTIDDKSFNYRLGYDIFDNNFMRVDSFKTGNTLNDFTGTALYGLSTMYLKIMGG